MDEDQGAVEVPAVVVRQWFRPGAVWTGTGIALILQFLQREEGIRSDELAGIAKQLGVELRTVQLSLQSLVRLGAVQYSQEDPRRRRYSINLDWKPNTSA